jgi:hypothetical protein
MYWDVSGIGSGLVAPTVDRAEAARDEADGAEPPTHLRSSKEVIGYRLDARDGPVGTLADFILAEDSWKIFYLSAKMDDGPEVVLPPEWVERISWAERKLQIDADRQTIRDSPPYQATMALTPAYDAELQRHYGRRRVWK